MDAVQWTAFIEDVINQHQDLIEHGHARFEECVLPRMPSAEAGIALRGGVDSLFKRHNMHAEIGMSRFEAYSKAIWFTSSSSHQALALPVPAGPTDAGKCCDQVRSLKEQLAVLEAEELRVISQEAELSHKARSLDAGSIWSQVLSAGSSDPDELKGNLQRLFAEATRLKRLLRDVQKLGVAHGDGPDTDESYAPSLAASLTAVTLHEVVACENPQP